MNIATTIEPPGTDLALVVSNDPGIVLLDTEKFDAWYERLKADAPVDADVTTKKGRDALRSYAADIRSEKAAIDKARLGLTKGWRDMVEQTNAAGKIIEQRLEALAVAVRKPLTDWEDAEKAHKAKCEAVITQMRSAATVTLDDTSETVRSRGTDVYSTVIEPDLYGDLYQRAVQVRDATIATLKAELARLLQKEADKAELEKLRTEAAEREARAAAERAAREAQEREEAESRQAEEQRLAAEKAEAERIEQAKEEAAQAERDRLQREHDEQIAAERQAADAARHAASMLQYIAEVVSGRIGGEAQPFGVLLRELETKVLPDIERCGDMRDQVENARVDGLAVLNRMMEEQAERRRREEAREEERKRLEAEHNKKLADEKNRALQRERKTEAKVALMACGISEDAAQKIVLAIRANEIPHVVWSR